MTNDQNTKDNAQEKLQADAAKGKAQDLKDTTQETAQTAKEGAQAIGSEAKEATQASSSGGESDLEATKAKAREVAQSASGKAQETGSKLQETAKTAGSKIETDLDVAKEKVSEASPIPTPQVLKAESSAQDLKARLDWGEPSLTILDVRDRNTHNQGHITGAMPMPLDELVERAQSSLDSTRDIYVYGESDKETAQAASKLREAGFTNVAELKGGLDAWRAVAGPIDGNQESYEPEWSQATNTVARVKDAIDKQSG